MEFLLPVLILRGESGCNCNSGRKMRPEMESQPPAAGRDIGEDV